MNKLLPAISFRLFLFFNAFLTAGYSQQVPPAVAPPSVALSVNIAKHINTSVVGEALSPHVNTAFLEYGPRPTKDGKRLYFSRQGYPGNTGGVDDEDIWYSEFDEATQSWSEAINPGPPLNNTGPNFITGVGNNGDTLLLANEYLKKGKMRAGVSVSIKVGELWSFPVPVKIAADYNFAERTGYDLSHDRNSLVIAQEKVDTHGKLDLYVAFRDPNKPTSYAGTESINLGPVINTFGDETSPWLAYDGRTLYFSSNGHNGYGKMDIFVTRRLDNTWTNWTEPENLGPGINSRYDDFSFNYNPGSRYAYYSRGFSSSNTDILQVDMVRLFLDDETNAAEIGQTKTVSNVFKDNESEIKTEAKADLQSILQYLIKNKTMVVLVTAHANSHANRTDSFVLSNERASKVVDYLVDNGIEKKRLSYNGLGHDIVVNTKELNIASAVEFKLMRYEK